MFKLNNTISSSSVVEEEDVKNTKSVLRDFGLYPKDKEIEGFTDNEMFDGIKDFQKIAGLKVDGVMRPKGETESEINGALSAISQRAGATKDFIKNWMDMRESNTIGSDKYFHCKANYEAAKRGSHGGNKAKDYSALRELYGHYIKGDPVKDMKDDMKANNHGRIHGKFDNKNLPAKEVCHPFRPRGLDDKY